MNAVILTYREDEMNYYEKLRKNITHSYGEKQCDLWSQGFNVDFSVQSEALLYQGIREVHKTVATFGCLTSVERGGSIDLDRTAWVIHQEIYGEIKDIVHSLKHAIDLQTRDDAAGICQKLIDKIGP